MSMAAGEERARIKTLDVLRGLAVLGILAVNAPFFAGPWQAAMNPTLPPLAITADTAWSWVVPHVFFEAKFITLFSLLFGASLYLVGGERSDLERGANLRRRLAWLLLFGIVHGALIWFGDILLVYAICGFVVLLARSWKPRTLLVVGLIAYALFASLVIGSGAAISFASAEQVVSMREEIWAPRGESTAEAIAAYRGGIVQSTMANFNSWTNLVGFDLIAGVPRTAAIMLIGLALFKWGFLSGNMPGWVYGILITIGALALAAISVQARLNLEAGFDFTHMQARGGAANLMLAPLVSLSYASVLIVSVKAGVLRILTNALAPVGRMAFTNYLTQSLIMTGIFYGGRGLGLYGQIDRPTLLLIVPAIWLLQMIWSPLWLSRYEMGPLEWVWRRLTYARPVPLRKPAGV